MQLRQSGAPTYSPYELGSPGVREWSLLWVCSEPAYWGQDEAHAIQCYIQTGCKLTGLTSGTPQRGLVGKSRTFRVT